MISDTEQPTLAPSIKPTRRRKLTIQDVEAIAKCVATLKLTEREACLHLEIEPMQWFSWKSKHKHAANFDNIITRTRANNIATLVNKIKNAGEDYEIQLPNDKIITKRGDWRANAFVLERVEPRFAQIKETGAATNVTIQISTIHEQLKRVIGFTTDAPRIGYEASLSADGMISRVEGADASKAKLGGIKMPIRRAATSTVVDI